MPLKLTGVVTRQLWDNPPTVSTVVTLTEQQQRLDVDVKYHLIREEARDHKKLMGDTMVEFRSAKWRLTFLEVPEHHSHMLPTHISEEDL